MPLPLNTLAEMRRDLARLHFMKDQIKAITEDRVRRLGQAPGGRPSAGWPAAGDEPDVGPCHQRWN